MKRYIVFMLLGLSAGGNLLLLQSKKQQTKLLKSREKLFSKYSKEICTILNAQSQIKTWTYLDDLAFFDSPWEKFPFHYLSNPEEVKA